MSRAEDAATSSTASSPFSVERAAGLHDVHDAVRETEARRQLDRARELHHLDRLAARQEVRGRPRAGTWSRRAPSTRGSRIRAAARARDHQPAAAEPEVERLVHVARRSRAARRGRRCRSRRRRTRRRSARPCPSRTGSAGRPSATTSRRPSPSGNGQARAAEERLRAREQLALRERDGEGHRVPPQRRTRRPRRAERAGADEPTRERPPGRPRARRRLAATTRAGPASRAAARGGRGRA